MLTLKVLARAVFATGGLGAWGAGGFGAGEGLGAGEGAEVFIVCYERYRRSNSRAGA